MNWQPIETAPKDGAEVWAFNGEQARMVWLEDEFCALWVWGDALLTEVDPSPDQPTHWMPLPAAPGAEPQGVAVDADGERYRWLFGARTAEELAALTADSGPPLDTPQDVVMCELMTNYVTKAYADAMIDSARADQTAAAKESP
ncbi:DUF551 domain-containing protein [Delftia deserti]|uniref:DUF551 domain-containing protein n=1 Tax=Delftia deserti TaxID=1651218 RepID=A0ABW5ELK1_9BURK